MIKQKVFNIGDLVECELGHYDYPRHELDMFHTGSNKWAVGKVIGQNDESDGPELVVEFTNNFVFSNRWYFPLWGHTRFVNEHWQRSGSLRVYNSGATREPHCQYYSIIELGIIPISTLKGNEDFYRSHFRKIVQNKYRSWPVCKIEGKTIDIKYYIDNHKHTITGTFECQYCCF